MGTVAFESGEDADRAIHLLNGYEVEGRPLFVKPDRFESYGSPHRSSGRDYDRHNDSYRGSSRGHPREHPRALRNSSSFTENVTGNGQPSNAIYVDNLPWSTTDDDLIELFDTIGKTERAEIKYERAGRSSGAGVVQFVDAAHATESIQTLQGYVYGGRPLSISYIQHST